MGFQSLYVILDSQLCFSNPVGVGDGTGWKIARGLFLRMERVRRHSDAHKTSDVQMCLMTSGTSKMPALMCSRAAFVCVDDLFCGLPFKRFVPKSVAQEKAFKVMDVLDAQVRTCAVLFLRCCEHGSM